MISLFFDRLLCSLGFQIMFTLVGALLAVINVIPVRLQSVKIKGCDYDEDKETETKLNT